MKPSMLLRWLTAAILLTVFACNNKGVTATDTSISNGQSAGNNADFTVLAGSENQGQQFLIDEWARANNTRVTVTYRGSVDIMRCLQQGKACGFDAVWLAQSLWIELGDRQKVLKYAKSIKRSPVVLALKKPIAARLAWTGTKPVSFKDILAAKKQGAFSLAMTSATQSNSGASAYLGIWYAMAGNPDMLQMANLNDNATRENVRQFLATVDRGAGSSGWLKETAVQNPEKFDSMFNYEAMVIEANRGWLDSKGVAVPGLVQRGQAPLCAVYPSDGLTVADSPLAYLDRGSADKEKRFLSLQQYLLSKPVQDKIQATGWRTGLLGLEVSNADASVWNPDWCIDTKRDITPVPTPSGDVITQALAMFQTDLRKPSLTVWVLDTSGSMGGSGIDGLRLAMKTLYDPATAESNLLQVGPRDVNIVMDFASDVKHIWRVDGSDPALISDLLAKTQKLDSGGGTNIYGSLIVALQQLKPFSDSGTLWNYLPAIILMTDGADDGGQQAELLRAQQGMTFGRDVPIHAIAFGSARMEQLKEVASAGAGKVFDSKGDLPKTLRDAKGYN